MASPCAGSCLRRVPAVEAKTVGSLTPTLRVVAAKAVAKMWMLGAAGVRVKRVDDRRAVTAVKAEAAADPSSKVGFDTLTGSAMTSVMASHADAERIALTRTTENTSTKTAS